jgi:hypothetical protein
MCSSGHSTPPARWGADRKVIQELIAQLGEEYWVEIETAREALPQNTRWNKNPLSKAYPLTCAHTMANARLHSHTHHTHTYKVINKMGTYRSTSDTQPIPQLKPTEAMRAYCGGAMPTQKSCVIHPNITGAVKDLAKTSYEHGQRQEPVQFWMKITCSSQECEGRGWGRGRVTGGSRGCVGRCSRVDRGVLCHLMPPPPGKYLQTQNNLPSQ